MQYFIYAYIYIVVSNAIITLLPFIEVRSLINMKRF